MLKILMLISYVGAPHWIMKIMRAQYNIGKASKEVKTLNKTKKAGLSIVIPVLDEGRNIDSFFKADKSL